MEHLLPALETEVVFDLKAAARAAVVEEASRAMERRLCVGPYEREDLNVLQKIIKADSGLKHDQVRWEVAWEVACAPFGQSVYKDIRGPHLHGEGARRSVLERAGVGSFDCSLLDWGVFFLSSSTTPQHDTG